MTPAPAPTPTPAHARALCAALAAGLAVSGPLPAAAETASMPAGDIAYGEYLSGQCTGCHLRGGGDAGIPDITGRDPEGF